MSISPRSKILLFDISTVVAAWILAWLARFNFEMPAQVYVEACLSALPIVVSVQAVIAWRFGLYRGLWRFASLPDLWNIVRAVVVGSVLIALGLFLVNRLHDVPRSVIILYPIFLVFAQGGPRLIYRVWKDRGFHIKAKSNAARVIIVGGGNGGEMLVRDMLREGNYVPVGFVDDNNKLARSNIHGVPVLGTVEELPEVVARRDVDMLVIAIPSATSAQMRRIVEACERARKPFRTVPQLQDMLSGQAGLATLREVSLEDLLGRDKVELEWDAIQASMAGSIVLVSGGGGSIGSELCRQIARLGVSRLVVFDSSEHNLYLIERELRSKFPHLEVVAVLGDVSDRAAVSNVFEHHRPGLVFHAAAFKHVPILQQQVREAVRVNVAGTCVMAECADTYQADVFVLISTDKAVRPSSVMGATKRVAELACVNLNLPSKTRFITVRFGNVLGSAGSVVPLFRQQIAEGGPVTVTHPEARRYFMTIPEACQLILEAGTVGHGGEIFVLDMGQPVTITYLAEQLIRLSGHVPGDDIEIVYSGLRPGEKLSEELFLDDETLSKTAHEKLLLAQHVAVDSDRVAEVLRQLLDNLGSFDATRLSGLIAELVPEMSLSNSDNSDPKQPNVVPISRVNQ